MAPSFSFYKVGITLAILSVFLSGSSALDPNFYRQSCPQVHHIVGLNVYRAIQTDPRMGASLLRLHFHDCFVNGCDGSVLLDDTPWFKGEKSAAPNINSLRGFEVIDAIKTDLEAACPGAVSCADILALAAAESVASLGLPFYWAELGREDATTASQGDANHSLPAPTLDLNGLISKFNDVGLDKSDLVVLSGGHTIGQARCTTFRGRLYNKTEVIDRRFVQALQRNCPKTSGKGDNNLAAIDRLTPNQFDNSYYANLVNNEGLFHSDQQLYSGNDPTTAWAVKMYSENPYAFSWDFTQAMKKMGRISGLSSKSSLKGRDIEYEIRKDCRMPNSDY